MGNPQGKKKFESLGGGIKSLNFGIGIWSSVWEMDSFEDRNKQVVKWSIINFREKLNGVFETEE